MQKVKKILQKHKLNMRKYRLYSFIYNQLKQNKNEAIFKP